MAINIDKFIDVSEAGALSGGSVVRSYTGPIAVRDAVYQRTDGDVSQADATSETTSLTYLGLVSAVDVPSPGEATITLTADLGGFAGLTVGSVYILSTSPGQLVRVEDTGNGNYPDTTPGSQHVLRRAGFAASANTMFVESAPEFLVS